MTHDVAELQLSLGPEYAWLLGAFVREVVLHAGAPLRLAHAAAGDADHAWRELCAAATPDELARIRTQVGAPGVATTFTLRGSARFRDAGRSWAQLTERGVGVRWRERGIEGWELRVLRPPALAAEPPAAQPEEGPAPAISEGELTIAPVEPGDAAGVGRCFLAVYGHDYLHHDVYSPHRYLAHIQDGTLIAVVARNAEGDVVGHLALERTPGMLVAERGEAVVLPAFRGRGLLGEMTQRLFEEAPAHGLIGVFSHPVTMHTISQHNDARAGMPIVAVLLGMLAESVHPHGMPFPTAGQRQSLLRAFAFLAPPPERVYHVPDIYADIVASLYAQMQALAVRRAGGAPAEAGSHVDVEADAAGFGTITFERIGRDAAPRLDQAVRDLRALDMKMLMLTVRLDDPAAPWLTETAREHGFFFAGLGPAFADGADLLVLQLLTEPLDTRKLQLLTDATKRLVAFIDADRAAVADLAAGPP